MSNIGPLDTYLSIRIQREPNSALLLDQQRYIEQIIDTHLPSDFKPAYVLCNTSFSDMRKDAKEPLMSNPYSGLIGMLQWVANGT